jgi:hypothetical protein
MGTELPTKVMLGKMLVLMQMTFLNNVRKVGRLVLSRTTCYTIIYAYDKHRHQFYTGQGHPFVKTAISFVTTQSNVHNWK